MATVLLLIVGTGMIAHFEWNASFAGMSVDDKLTQAFFNAVCPRTAGFSSVDLTAFTMQSILIYIFLMWIGGAAQSTAGGIKVNAFAVVFIDLIAVLRGTPKVHQLICISSRSICRVWSRASFCSQCQAHIRSSKLVLSMGGK